MGKKDHLGTIEEANKHIQKEQKKVNSTVFLGNPPGLTSGLDSIGLFARTTGEVRDTDFPILRDMDDQTKNLLVDPATTNLTYTIDLGNQEAHFHRLEIADFDDDTVPTAITNIDVVFTNLAINKEIEFTLEFIKDPAMVTTPTITFSPPLNGAPAQPSPFPDDFAVYYFLISGRTLPDNTTRYELLNLGTGSGGGNTFPILYPEETIGSIGGPTQNINISGTNGQFKELTLTGNVNLTFSGFPSATVLEEFWVLVNQDGVGGHSLTATGSTVKNAGTLNSLLDPAANSQTLFHFATGDAGATIHAELVDLVASGGGFSGNLSDLVIDVNKDWNNKSINNLAGIDLFAGAVANSVTNASVITFISNAAAARGQFGRSDFFGTAQGLALNITANDNFVIAVDTVQKVKFDDTADLITTEYDLNMAGNFITNIGYLESNTPLRPAIGFIRMAASDQIAIRNPLNSDDIFLGVGNDSLVNESFQVTVASGIQLTVSAFNIDVKSNNIIETGNITPAAGAQDIGDAGNPYTDIFAQYFRPVSAAATTKDGYTKVGTNRQLISFDSGTAESGFGIYRDGVQRFLFSQPFGNVYEFFIGRDPFLAGEEYRIQLGENSNSSARIFMIEGGGNDLILDRQGAATTRGVQLRAGGLSTFIATTVELKAFSPLNMNSEDIFNARLIKADTSNLAQIGEFQPSNGGFDYLVRDRVSWDTDPDTYIEFNSSGISVVSDDNVVIASGLNDNVTIASDDQMNIFVTDGAGLTLTIGGGFPKFTFQDNAFISQEEIVMSGQKIVNMADPTASQDAATKFYVDSVAGGGVLGAGNASIVIVKAIDVFRVSSTTLLDDVEMKFDAEANKLYYIEVNGVFSASTTGDLKCGASIPSGAKYAIVNAGINNDWSAFTTVDGGQSLVFQGSGTTDFRANNFWVLVETAASSGTVAISVAQNQSTSSLTTWRKGSTMRVFQEGTSLPGGITQDIVLGTPDPSEFWVEDTGKQWIGNGNSSNNLGDTLPTTEPGGFTDSYTIDSNDFPAGAIGWSFDAFGAFATWTIENIGGGTPSFAAKLFINGRQFATQGFGISTWAAASGWTTVENVKSGDVIAIKAWSTSGSTNLRLRQRGIYTFPKAITVTAAVNSLSSSPDFTNEFIGTLPSTVTGAELDQGEVFEYYAVNDQIWIADEPNFEPFNFGDVIVKMVTGETARIAQYDRQTFAGGPQNRFPVPYWQYPFGRYRTTSK